MYETVLVPSDGSDDALRAAAHGAALAKAFDARLHLLTVVDLQTAGGPFDAGGLETEFRERLRADAEERIDATESAMSVTNGLRTAIEEGPPVRTILEYADDHDVDLVAMGTQGRTGLDHYVAGSVAEGVVRQARVPVLTVRDTAESDTAGESADVLLPTDGSEYAARAIEPGLAIAERFGTRVHVLHVLDPGDLPADDTRAAVVERLEADGDAVTETVAERVSERGLEAVTAVREGVAPAAILDYAEAEGIDLIAMATAGKTGPSRFLLGSTTERAIRHAEIPVVAVNARD